jgi:hypothetical protein
MMPTKFTLLPCLSKNIVPDSYAGSEHRRNHHAAHPDSLLPLSDTGTQRWDAWLDGQTWHSCLRWRQRLRQWYARHFSARESACSPRRLDDQWDALHERVQAPTTEDSVACIAQTHPSLRMGIYTSLT